MGATVASCVEGIFPGPSAPKNIILKYFPIAGRAEPIRLALALGKVQFYDQRISGQEWEVKHKPQMPYGQLPVLVVDGKMICQTKAILRYVGKIAKYNGTALYPKDVFAAAKVDELLDAFDDLWILLAPTFTIQDEAQKAAARQQLFAPGGPATAKVEVFERMLSASSSGSGFCVPQAGLTVADLMYFSFFNVLRSGFVDGLGADLFKKYPNITRHKELVAAIPEICAYYQDAALSNPHKVPFYEVFQPGK